MESPYETSCTICFLEWSSDDHNQACCLPCGHVLCYPCCIQIAKDTVKCPICRAEFKPQYVRKMCGLPQVVLDQELLKKNESDKSLNDSLKSEREALAREINDLQEKNRKMKEILFYGSQVFKQ